MWQFYVFMVLTLLALWGMARKLIYTPLEVTKSEDLTTGLFLFMMAVMLFGLYLNWSIFTAFGGVVATIMFTMHILSSSYYTAHMLLTGKSIEVGMGMKVYSMIYSLIMTAGLFFIGFTHIW